MNRTKNGGALVGAALVLALSGAARAEGMAPGRTAWRHPEITVRAGAVFPMFLIYEVPGPLAGVDLRWRVVPHLEVVASAEVGAMFADGARRYLASLGAGVRAAPWRQGPWLQLGLGTAGFVERIGLVLPERMISSTDTGLELTAELGLGARVRQWELAISYDRILRRSPYYRRYDGVGGDEAQPFDGIAMVTLGRAL